MILAFIEEQRAKRRSVGSICKILREQGVRVAERTYRAWRHAQPSNRELADAVVIDAIGAARVDAAGQATPESMYGRRKMTALLRRHGLAVSKRQVDRLMRQLRINGLVRGKGVRTTIPDRNAARAPDLLDRDFTAPAPNRRWVADFTYVRTWSGFVYVSFVIDCYSRAIVGWHASSSEDDATGDQRAADGTVATRPRRAPRRGRASASQRCGLAVHERVVRGDARSRGHRRVHRIDRRRV